MKEKIRRRLFPGLTLVFTVAAALFWVALRVNYSGISKFLGADTNRSFLILTCTGRSRPGCWKICWRKGPTGNTITAWLSATSPLSM